MADEQTTKPTAEQVRAAIERIDAAFARLCDEMTWAHQRLGDAIEHLSCELLKGGDDE